MLADRRLDSFRQQQRSGKSGPRTSQEPGIRRESEDLLSLGPRAQRRHRHHGSPDYQYTPKQISAMAGLVASDLYACILASRIFGGGARFWPGISRSGVLDWKGPP
jgi:hypothetical protein